MAWFRNIKIGSKLILVLTLMIFLMAVLGWVGYLNISNVSGQMVQIHQVRLPSLDYLLQTDRDLQQLMVAERSLLSTDPAAAGFDTLLQAYEDNLKQSEERWIKAKKLLVTNAAKGICVNYEKARAAWFQASTKVLDYCRQGTADSREKAIVLSMGEASERFETMRGEIDKLTELVEKTAAQEAEIGRQIVARSLLNTLLLLAVAVLFAIGGGWLLYRVITDPLRKALRLAEGIAQGDLSLRLHMNHRDETGFLARMLDTMAENLTRHVELAEKIALGDLTVKVKLASDRDQFGKALQSMTERLNDLVSQVQNAVGQITSGSEQVADTSQTLSQGAAETAASLEEITASMTQMASQTKLTAQNAEQANSLSKGSRNAATRGDKLMHELVDAMGEIDRSGQDINKIIKVIDEIAFQTNLLALNAAVEAARAGQHGKGFAVVAEEVRNLAARSAKAAKETAELIENSAEKTRNGNSIAEKTAAAFKGIVAGAAKVTDLVGEIAAAANEQASGFEQVNQGLGQIDQVTQQNTAHAEESAAAAEELSGQSAQLKNLVGRFKVRSNGRAASSAEKSVEVKSRPALPARPSKNPPKTIARTVNRSGQDAPAGKRAGKSAVRPASESAKAPQRVENKPAKASSAPSESQPAIKPEEVIALDDTEFGKY